MEKLEIDLKEAQELFKEKIPEAFRKKLIKKFGIENISNNIMDRVTSFLDALALATKEIKEEYYKTVNKDTPDHIVGEAELIVIISVINEKYVADYSNSKQEKWFPVHRVLPSGVGFDYSSTYYDYSNTHVGVRLVLENEEKSNYVGKQFIEQYTKMYTYKK